MRGGFSLEWGVIIFVAGSVCGIAVERCAPTVRLRTFHRSPTNGARNLLHIAPPLTLCAPYSCGTILGRVIFRPSLQAYLWKKTSLEWDLMHYVGDSVGRLAAHYRPSAHSLQTQLHFPRNTPPGALSLQHVSSRAATKRTAPTCIFAIFERIPGETVKGPKIGVRNSVRFMKLTSYATSHVESVTFPSSHREKFVRDPEGRAEPGR